MRMISRLLGATTARRRQQVSSSLRSLGAIYCSRAGARTLCSALLLIGLAGPAAAQQWAPIVVEIGDASVDPLDPALTQTPAEAEPDADAREIRRLSVGEIGSPLSHDEVLRLNGVARSATLQVEASFRQSPLVIPNVRVLEGAATLVALEEPEAEPVLITSAWLVHGAEVVTIRLPNGVVVSALPEVDLDHGLAVLEVPAELLVGVEPLPVRPLRADEPVEILSTIDGSLAAMIGAGEGQHAFYQVNTSGAVLGYPLIDRSGSVVGIGSHRYPTDPTLTLSIPSEVVLEYLEAR